MIQTLGRYLFSLLRKLLTYAYNPKATPKECLELKFSFKLTSKIPNSCGCYREEEGLHAIARVKEESLQSNHNGRIFLMMIDNNVYHSCQYVH